MGGMVRRFRRRANVIFPLWRRRRAFSLKGMLLATIAVAFLVVAGCGGDDDGNGATVAEEENGAPPQGSLCVVSLVKVGAALSNLELLQAVAEDNNLEYNENVAEGDFDTAISQIQTCARDQDTAAIVSVALENAAVEQAISNAEQNDIPFISEYGGEPTAEQTFAVEMDEEHASQLLADYVAENIGEELEYIMVTAEPLPTVRDRVATFQAAAEPGWDEVGSVELDLMSPAEGTATLLESELRANPDVDLIVTPWDDPAAGAVTAIRQTGSEDTRVVTYDGVEATWAQMRAGDTPIVAVAGQPTVAVGGMVNRQLKRILDGQEPEQKRVLCQGPLVTQEENIPDENQPLGGGTCLLDGETLPAEELSEGLGY